MPSRADDPPRRAVRRDTSTLRRSVTVAGVALILLIVAVDSYEAWQDYRRVIVDNEHIMLALNRALTEQTERLVQEVEVVLADYAAWTTSAEGRTADQRALVARLNSQIVSLPFVSSALLIGADGKILAGTRDDDVTDRNFKELAVFSAPAHDPGNALYIDRPRFLGRDRAQTFALSRRVTTPGGEFTGVVVARVAFDYLAAFYSGVNVTPDTSIRLSRVDGVTLAEYPPGGRLGDEAQPHPVAGAASAKERIKYKVTNGDELIEVAQQVGRYPIELAVSRSYASVLRPWMAEERSSAARTLTLAAFATLLLVALRRALDRQDAMDHERQRLEQELAGIRQVEALGFLAASVAHDFNNVLTAIIGYAELMRGMVEAQPAMLANVDRLLAATERARVLVRRVLTFDPRRSVSYRPTAVEPIIIEVAQLVEATLPASVRIKLDGVDGVTSIQGDATEIHQVLMNLCSNAVHAMPAGGILNIQLATREVREPKTLALGQLQPGRWVSVSVIDSGIGLAAEQITSMFEPFYTTRQSTHGTGIGLTVVRNIISRMDGALEVDSRLGSGTRMIVYWRAVAAAAVAAAAELPEPAALREAGDGEVILVLDDEKELVALTEELLASLSYEPVGFSDARTAIEVFKSHPERFDAVLTDERMQPLRGLEFARLIHDIDPRVPIILMTGHRDAKLDAGAAGTGVVEILDKPLRVQTLREALARQLKAARV
jgi:signal transduction histidine kinase/ActR/RegA family two-component response regulator